jgi:uncharacterized iron-regulated protein
MHSLKLIFLILLLKFFSLACSHTGGATQEGSGQLVDGKTLESIELSAALRNVRPGDVLIVSELHGYRPHHKNQRAALSQLQSLFEEGQSISVGLEFFEKQHQDLVDKYVQGKLSETKFLATIQWKNISFEHYRFQALFARISGGQTLAINAPRWLTSKVAQGGLSSLDEDEKTLLPLGFELGNEIYFERFQEAMKGHVPPSALMHYFEAQSVWDDVMAESVAQHLQSFPDEIVVIIVGDFHAAYGGGLPQRLEVRGVSKVHVISQVRIQNAESDGLAKIEPHPLWGPRADFIWIE